MEIKVDGARVGHLEKVTQFGISYYNVYARYKGEDELLVSVDGLKEAKSFVAFYNTKQRWADALLSAYCFLGKSREDKRKLRGDYLAQTWTSTPATTTNPTP